MKPDQKTTEAEQIKVHALKEDGEVVFRLYQYNYRTDDGFYFSTVSNCLDSCRSKRDDWLKKLREK